jgi:membrane-bound lytic murein transglycosylase A
MVAHDVGSAIKGPERGDIYFGSGDTAGRLAGITKHPGHLFALVAIQPSAAPVVAKEGVAPKPPARQAKQ